MSLATLQISQPGAGITLAPDVSGNLSSVDAGGASGRCNTITVSAYLAGGVLASECTFTLVVRDCPPGSHPTVSTVSAGVWSLVIDAGAWGALALSLTVSRFSNTETTVRRYNFPSPIHSISLPANAEVVDGSTSNANFGGAVNRTAWYSISSSLEPRPYPELYRQIVDKLETVAPYTSINTDFFEVSGQILSLTAAARTPALDEATFFARPAGVPTPATGIPSYAALDMLGARAMSRSVERFGAVGDDVTDDTVALQAAIDYCVLHGYALYSTQGKTYRTVDMLQVGTGSAIATLYWGVTGSCSLDQTVSAKIHATATNKPAINIQGARGVHLENIYVSGDNTAASDNGVHVNPSPDVSQYVSPGLSNTRWAPHCGIAIDSLSGSDPGSGYAGKTYGQFTSIGVTLSRCISRGFVVAYANWGTGANGDSVRWVHCEGYLAVIGIAICDSQTRANLVVAPNFEFIHTFYDGNTYGHQNGSPPTIIGGEIVLCYRFFNANTNNAPLNVYGTYTESICSIGIVTGPQPVLFSGVYFYLGGQATFNPIVHGYLSTLATSFIGCSFVRNDQNFLNLITQAGGRVVFQSCSAVTNDSPTADFKMNEHVQGFWTVIRESSIGKSGSQGNMHVNESVTVYSAGAVSRPAQGSRFIEIQQGTSVGYLFDGVTHYKRTFRDGAVPLSASTYNWVNGTVSFTAGSAGEFLVGDQLYWKLAVRNSTSNPDAPTSYNALTDSLAIALRVTSTIGSAVTAVALGAYQQLDRSVTPDSVYVAHIDWAPTVPLTVNLSNGSALMTANYNNALQVGDFVLAATGLPSIVRVIATPTMNTYTLSKNATADRFAEPIYCSQLKGIA